MKKKTLLYCIFIIAFFLIVSSQTFAQLPQPDSLQTNSGKLLIQPVFHAGIVMQFNGKTIYVDPYNGANLYQGMPAPDLILITDIHPDHLDTATLGGISTSNAVFVVPQAVAALLPDKYKSKMVVIGNGQSTTQTGIAISAIPMYNLPNDATARHPKGRGNGYILTLGGKKIYISGDTEDIPEMRSLKGIDVAFVCMNLPYTMSIEQAASGVLAFKPKVVYPYHYRNENGFSDVNGFKALVNAKDKNIDVRLRNWYIAASTQQ